MVASQEKDKLLVWKICTKLKRDFGGSFQRTRVNTCEGDAKQSDGYNSSTHFLLSYFKGLLVKLDVELTFKNNRLGEEIYVEQPQSFMKKESIKWI